MQILITGAAGFIGFHLAKKLLQNGHSVVGVDNINDYYNPDLKLDRLEELGLKKDQVVFKNTKCLSSSHENLVFYKSDLTDDRFLNTELSNFSFDLVCHLAAQPGVRYSIENPKAYIESNIVAFLNIMEFVRSQNIKRILYASSSSVYGELNTVPFSENDVVDKPVSLYAATKKSNELMAFTYSHLYKIETIGLRFFTVYGPWGRPDMAYFSFTKNISEGKEIQLYNMGNMFRDFTYIDDIVDSITVIAENKKGIHFSNNYKVYNIGNNRPEKLIDFINVIEQELDKMATIKYVEMQMGDVTRTYADISSLTQDFGYKPNTSIKEGIAKFITWYKSYYHKIS